MCVLGAVPVTIRPPHPQNLQTTLPTVRMIVDVSKSVLVLSNQNVIKLLKSKVIYVVSNDLVPFRYIEQCGHCVSFPLHFLMFSFIFPIILSGSKQCS